MTAFLDMDCGGETVTIEKTDNGDIIFHGWDEETELAAIELGFEPSLCLMLWNAINNDKLDIELLNYTSDGNTLMVETLLFAGASANAIGLGGWSPLHEAAAEGNADVVKVLLEAGASVDARTKSGETPFSIAISVEVAEILKDWIEDHGK